MAGFLSNNNIKNYFPANDGTFMAGSSFKNIYAIRNMFRTAGGYSDQYNMLDNPGTLYFKLMFKFDNRISISDNGSHAIDTNASNLLSLDVDTATINQGIYYDSTNNREDHTFANSALNYLLLNNEYERAELLVQFIQLLAEINTYSPWYFSELDGLSEALERKEFTDKDFKVDEDRRTLTIKCLPDSVDMRIGTLIDLYRSVCFSYTHKKEIVPANLRKFDLGVFIFSNPMFGLTRYKSSDNVADSDNFADMDFSLTSTGSENPNYHASIKYLEFHNCEIDINSSKTGLDSIDNKEGKQPEYSISMWYDSCYEMRYNEFLMRQIGDYVYSDIFQRAQKDQVLKKVQGPIPYTEIDADPSIAENQVEQENIQNRRIHPRRINANSGSTPRYRGKYRNGTIYYDDLSSAPGSRFAAISTAVPQSKGFLASNIESAIDAALKKIGLKTPADPKKQEGWLGNIYFDEITRPDPFGVLSKVDDIKKKIKDITSGRWIASKIANL